MPSSASCRSSPRRSAGSDTDLPFALHAGADVYEMLTGRPRGEAHIDGKDVVKVIVVPAKLVNFVVR
jgi:hypothetical protein